MKGFTVNELASVAIVFVVAAFAIAMGGNILQDLSETQDDCLWGTYTSSAAVDPATGSNTGCCSSINASEALDCDTWASGYDYNATVGGLESQDQFATWLPTLALVIIAAVIIGVLMMYLAGRKE